MNSLNNLKAGIVAGGGAPKSATGQFSLTPKQQLMVAAGQGLLNANRGQLVDIGNGFMMRDRSGIGAELMNSVGSTLSRQHDEMRRDLEREEDHKRRLEVLRTELDARALENNLGRDFRRELDASRMGHDVAMFDLRKGLTLERDDANRAFDEKMTGLDFENRLTLQGNAFGDRLRLQDDAQEHSDTAADKAFKNRRTLINEARKFDADTKKEAEEKAVRAALEERAKAVGVPVRDSGGDLMDDWIRDTVEKREQAAREKENQLAIDSAEVERVATETASRVSGELVYELGEKDAKAVGEAIYRMIKSGVPAEQAEAQIMESMKPPTPPPVTEPGTSTTADDYLLRATGRR